MKTNYNYKEIELPLWQQKAKIDQSIKRYYTIAYFGNYGAQVRNYALNKIIELEEEREKIKEKIKREREKIWKNYN